MNQEKTDFTKNVLAGIGSVAILTMIVLAVGGFTGDGQQALTIGTGKTKPTASSALSDKGKGTGNQISGICSGSGLYSLDSSFNPAGNWSGVAVGADGTVYMASALNKKITILYKNGTTKDINLGDKQPNSIAVDSKGTIYFVSENAPSLYYVDASGTPKKISMPVGRFVGFVYKVTVAPDDSVWVADSDKNPSVLKFTSNANGNTFENLQIGQPNENESGKKIVEKYYDFNKGDPAKSIDDISIAGGSLYVLDDYQNVAVFNLSGDFIKKLSFGGLIDGMHVGADGKIYLASAQQGKVYIYDANGKALSSVSSGNPRDVVLDSSGNMYVLSSPKIEKFLEVCAKIIVIKEVSPVAFPVTFDFTKNFLGGGNFSLTVPKVNQNPPVGSDQVEFALTESVEGKEFTVDESQNSAYSTTVTCDKFVLPRIAGAPQGFTTNRLVKGDVITCTFKNKLKLNSLLTIVKEWDPGTSNDRFNFGITSSFKMNESFSLVDNGDINQKSRVYNLPGGQSYTITETPKSGLFVYYECKDKSGKTVVPRTRGNVLSLTPNQVVQNGSLTCTFLNRTSTLPPENPKTGGGLQ